MKAIQDSAMPIVVPMIRGEAVALARREQRTLAGWIAISVMCSEFGKDQLRAISQKDRNILHRYHVAPRANWRIWIGRYPHKMAQWDHRALLIVPEKKQPDPAAYAAAPTYNTQSTTYTVGNLFVHVISSEWAKCVRNFQMVHSGRLVQIWPPNGTPVIWPPAHVLSDDESAHIAAGFFEGLRRAGTPS